MKNPHKCFLHLVNLIETSTPVRQILSLVHSASHDIPCRIPVLVFQRVAKAEKMILLLSIKFMSYY
jgi:hypothetical protein